MSSSETRWDYVTAKPPKAGGVYREVATYNELNVDNLTVYSGTRTNTLFVSSLAELSGPTILRNTLSVLGSTTLNTLTVNSWSILSGPVVTRSTLSVRENAAVGSLYVVSSTTMVGGVECLSNMSVEGTLVAGGDIVTRSRFSTSVGYVDPEVGDIKTNVLPMERNGWLLCDGRPVLRSDYPALFDCIGTAFGGGDGVSTFNLPNAGGRVLGTVGGGRNWGESVGSETVSLSTGNLPAHTHSGSTSTEGLHSHGVNDPGHTHTQWTVNDDFNNSQNGNPPGFADDSAGYRTWNNINSSTTGITVATAGSHAHTFTTDGGSGLNGGSFGVMQPTLFVGYTFIFSGVPTAAL